MLFYIVMGVTGTLRLPRRSRPMAAGAADTQALTEAFGIGRDVSKGADANLGVWVDEVIWYRDARDVGLSFRDAPRRRVFRTPLSEALGDRHLDVVQFLISVGARD